jgi:hypothetical protein
MDRLKLALRHLVVAVARRVGSRIIDHRTGQVLGRALLVPFRGRILVIGLEPSVVVPTFLPQKRLTYWKQDLGFMAHPPPDFPHEPRP